MEEDVTSNSLRWTQGLEVSGLLRRAAEPGWIMVDGVGVIRAINQEAMRLLRTTPDALLEQSVDQLPSPLSWVYRETCTGSSGTVERLISLSGGGGGCQVAGFRWQAGVEDFSVLLVLQDLTPARELEAKTDRLQKLATVGTLSATVAHEIKNALVVIKTSADLLLESHPGLESAALVRDEVGRIDSLVTQLLRFAGPVRPVREKVHLHVVIGEALRLVQHAMHIQQIECQTYCGAKEDCVQGDSQQLQQGLLNLFLNAVEAMPQGGRLVIRTEQAVATEHISRFEPRRREPQIQLEVTDSGPGIAPELKDRLFAPFATTKPDGTGLGLAIAHRIIKEHRGAITAESHPGVGATFRVLLPISHQEG